MVNPELTLEKRWRSFYSRGLSGIVGANALRERTATDPGLIQASTL